jgi:hypothetical protein
MLGPLPPLASVGVKGGSPVPAPESRGASARAAAASPPASPDAVPPDRAAEAAVEVAARSHHAGRDVEVKGFRDAASGHYVLRVADRRTGLVLHQSPPDALLRFFAAARQQDAGPLLRLDA